MDLLIVLQGVVQIALVIADIADIVERICGHCWDWIKSAFDT